MLCAANSESFSNQSFDELLGSSGISPAAEETRSTPGLFKSRTLFFAVPNSWRIEKKNENGC